MCRNSPTGFLFEKPSRLKLLDIIRWINNVLLHQRMLSNWAFIKLSLSWSRRTPPPKQDRLDPHPPYQSSTEAHVRRSFLPIPSLSSVNFLQIWTPSSHHRKDWKLFSSSISNPSQTLAPSSTVKTHQNGCSHCHPPPDRKSSDKLFDSSPQNPSSSWPVWVLWL